MKRNKTEKLTNMRKDFRLYKSHFQTKLLRYAGICKTYSRSASILRMCNDDTPHIYSKLSKCLLILKFLSHYEEEILKLCLQVQQRLSFRASKIPTHPTNVTLCIKSSHKIAYKVVIAQTINGMIMFWR